MPHWPYLSWLGYPETGIPLAPVGRHLGLVVPKSVNANLGSCFSCLLSQQKKVTVKSQNVDERGFTGILIVSVIKRN